MWRICLKVIFLVLFFFPESKSEAFSIFHVPSSDESIMDTGVYSQDFLDSGQSGNLKIMIWNMAEKSDKFWKKEILSFSKDVDLILLQEIAMDDHQVFSFFESEVFHGFHMAFSFIRLKKNKKTGVAIGSKAKPSSFSFTRSDKELLYRTPKNISFATFELCRGDCNVLVVNAHMLWLSFFDAYRRQLEDIKQIVQVHEGPVIVAGDFNTWNGKRVNLMKHYMELLGLSKVVFKNKKGITHPLTHMALDHIFVSKSFVEAWSFYW